MNLLKSIKLFFLTAGPQYSWKKALVVWVLSTLTIFGSCSAGFFIYRYCQSRHILYAKSNIEAVIQTGVLPPPFPVRYLAEVLDLSADRPVNLAHFSLEQAEEKLVSTHVIQWAHVKKMKPNVLFIDYKARDPIFFLDDMTNTALDDQGFFFPFAPFYSPRSLPHLYLGSVSSWGEQLKDDQLELVNILILNIGLERIRTLDLSLMSDPSAGKREVVVSLTNGNIVRLTPKNIGKQLQHYLILDKTILNDIQKPIIFDLRLTDIAFIQSLEDGLHTHLLDILKPR